MRPIVGAAAAGLSASEVDEMDSREGAKDEKARNSSADDAPGEK
jgi:hypothetical protein